MKPIVYLVLFLVAPLVYGIESKEIHHQPAITDQLEMGISAGSPAWGNANLGYWGTPSLPLLVRIYGLHWGYGYGAGGEIGWLFDAEGAFRQYVAVGGEFGSYFWPFSLHTGEGGGGGIHYGFNWNGWSLDVGLNIGTVRWGWLFWETGSQVGLLPSLQVGYSWFFDI